jgi:hypothetical protein
MYDKQTYPNIDLFIVIAFDNLWSDCIRGSNWSMDAIILLEMLAQSEINALKVACIFRIKKKIFQFLPGRRIQVGIGARMGKGLSVICA